MSPRNLQRWILVGLAGGIALGVSLNLLTGPGGPAAEWRGTIDAVTREAIEPAGKIFLRLLFLTVLPLVFSSLVLGIKELGNPRELGRVGMKVLAFTLGLSGLSVLIGLLLVNAVRPGERLSDESRRALVAMAPATDAALVEKSVRAEPTPRLERIVNAVVPRNPVEAAARAFDGDMLSVMFFALLFGVALAAIRPERGAAVVAFLEGLYDVSMWLVGFAMRLAPLGVAALVFSVTSRMGFDILRLLAAYVLTVLAGLAVQQTVVYSLVLAIGCRMSPLEFFRRIRPAMVTAFSTSSSNATLPTTIHVARTRLGIPARIANFVLTLGSTFNQNGTALFEGVTVVFIAQAYGVPLTIEQQLLVLAMAVLAGVGTAGVPGGSIPLIVPVLVGVGVPAQGIAIILGVDRFLDMCRTVLNVTGDMVAATFIARSEGELEIPPDDPPAVSGR